MIVGCVGFLWNFFLNQATGQHNMLPATCVVKNEFQKQSTAFFSLQVLYSINKECDFWLLVQDDSKEWVELFQI